MDKFVNTCFIFDIVVGFTTAYRDESTGDEIFSLKEIASHYIFDGDFIFDFLSTIDIIGFTYDVFGLALEPTSSMGIFKDLLAMLKVYRIRKLLQQLR